MCVRTDAVNSKPRKSKDKGKDKEKEKGGRERKADDDAKEKNISITLPEGRVDLETHRAKTRLLMQKQDKLLCVGGQRG